MLAELQYGISKSKKLEENQNKLNILLSRLEVRDYNAKSTFFYGELRAKLEQKGSIIGNNDLLIASHVIAEDAILVTNNTKEFKRIPNLVLENWGIHSE